MNIPFSLRNGVVFPNYFYPQDAVWLRIVLDEYSRFVGLPRRMLRERWNEPLPCASPEKKLRMAIRILDRLAKDRQLAVVPPRRARLVLFAERAACGGTRESALEGGAAKLGITADELSRSLFADLPGERRVGPLPPDLSPSTLLLRANMELVQGLLQRASEVTVRLLGRSSGVVRTAKLHGLICTVEGTSGNEPTVLHLSGPLSVLRRTTIYGRALSALAPVLLWCNRFHLQAVCILDGEERLFDLRPGDALLPGIEPHPYDSKLEARFAREFAKIAPGWDIIREPEPIPAGRTLIFPDFAVQNRRDPARRWLIEIAGFWTVEYLAHKLTLLRRAAIENLILCVDEDRACGADEFPPHARVIRFHKRPDAAAVLQVIEGHHPRGSANQPGP